MIALVNSSIVRSSVVVRKCCVVCSNKLPTSLCGVYIAICIEGGGMGTPCVSKVLYFNPRTRQL